MLSEEVRHPGLGKVRIVTARDACTLQEKVRIVRSNWDRQFRAAKSREAERRKANSLKQREVAENSRALTRKLEKAEKLTQSAQDALHDVKCLLIRSLETKHKIDWKDARDVRERTREVFDNPKPDLPDLETLPEGPDYSRCRIKETGRAPAREDAKYQPQLRWIDRLVPARREKRQTEARMLYEADLMAWNGEKERNDREACEARAKCEATFERKKAKLMALNTKRMQTYEKELQKWDLEQKAFLEKQDAAERRFYELQNKRNAVLQNLREAYERRDPAGVEDYCRTVLNSSKYPRGFPKIFDLEYQPETKILMVEWRLPGPEAMPTLFKVEYVVSKDDFKDSYLSNEAVNSLYDDALYQIALRVPYELFDAVASDAVEAVNFNGWVEAVNKATGKTTKTCVLALFVRRGQLRDVDLAGVDPKTCFKSLKGIGSTKLHSLTAVAPIMQIERSDKRFVAAYTVADSINDEVNIAAMDWEDFEHLVREIFEKEFTNSGGEVKITQASRDGGVDAVAFDPDPIRGGKIVIQAKRYTNVVQVSAVRDLYGTVVNEGATKGILVTTADYGPDAYDFAKDKPLTLLNGANLLHLLEKHGHKAKIDLHEAKKMLAEREREALRATRAARMEFGE